MNSVFARDVQRVISVRELNALARDLVEASLPLLWVGGEVSNFTRAPSGHCYFSLKDAHAQVRCVMFRQKAMLLEFQPANGMQIEVRALPTLYEARGEFQLGVETMRQAGLGALYEAFERLRKKLEAEGLFAQERKRPLPSFPRSVGVVTSLAAAAMRDVLTTLARRMPGIRVILYPAPVQGEGAAARLAQALETASGRKECDVLILCRGGGSIEDLWAFNDEQLARTIARCAIPVVSGVGHESDFTIADFVADARAPTPTAAAEMVSPDAHALRERLAQMRRRMTRQIRRFFAGWMQRLDYLGKRLQHPGERFSRDAQQIEAVKRRLRLAMAQIFAQHKWRVSALARKVVETTPAVAILQREQSVLGRRLAFAWGRHIEALTLRSRRLASSLEHLNPQAVLERGYSIARLADGELVRDSAQLSVGADLRLRFARGQADVEVTNVESELK